MANPPITIGELIDVPAPGSPIASAWAQEATRRISHRFATIAERDAKYPAATAGPGALCGVASTALYMSDGVGWLVITEPPRGISGAAAAQHWNNDASLPLVWQGALPSSATSTAVFARRGSSVDFSITLASGAAGGLTGAGFNLPFTIGNIGTDNVGFVGSWTSSVGNIAPAMFYKSTGWQPAFYVVATGGAAAIAAVPSGTIPFPSTANQKMAVQGTYMAAAPPYG